MKTKVKRSELMKEFGFETWGEFRALLTEAQSPYPISWDWMCIAKGRSREARKCIFRLGAMTDPNINAAYVSTNDSYLRFNGDERIFRYNNPLEMRRAIEEFDEFGTTDMEPGETILEPLAKTAARSTEYQNARRRAIKEGTHVVKPRGPNVNMRRNFLNQEHHFRPI